MSEIGTRVTIYYGGLQIEGWILKKTDKFIRFLTVSGVVISNSKYTTSGESDLAGLRHTLSKCISGGVITEAIDDLNRIENRIEHG